MYLIPDEAEFTRHSLNRLADKLEAVGDAATNQRLDAVAAGFAKTAHALFVIARDIFAMRDACLAGRWANADPPQAALDAREDMRRL